MASYVTPNGMHKINALEDMDGELILLKLPADLPIKCLESIELSPVIKTDVDGVKSEFRVKKLTGDENYKSLHVIASDRGFKLRSFTDYYDISTSHLAFQDAVQSGQILKDEPYMKRVHPLGMKLQSPIISQNAAIKRVSDKTSLTSRNKKIK